MKFVKVWTELSDGKFQSLPAKIVSERDKEFTIKYLSATEKKTPLNNKRIYEYEEETYDVTEDSIIEHLSSELDLGFEEFSEGQFIRHRIMYSDDDDEDSDYVPSSSEEDSDSDSEEDLSETGDEDEDEEEYYSSGEEI